MEPLKGVAGSLRLIAKMFVDPAEAFAALQVMRTRALWVPLLLLLVSSSALFLIYYQVVNIGWLQDQMAANGSREQADVTRKLLTRNILSVTAVFGVVIAVPFIDAIYALYFFLIGKVQGLPQSFGKWFAFVVWSSVPTLLLLPIGFAVLLLATSGQVAPDQLNPTSLDALLFHRPTGDGWKSLLGSVSILSLWSSLLMVIGLRVWTSCGWGRAFALAMLPLAVVYIPWAAIVFASTLS